MSIAALAPDATTTLAASHGQTRPDSIARLSYRPDIDGMRAVAVMAVIGFHAFPGHIKGGFVGVDVFFVISGFLISTIIFTGLESGKFTFLGFYTRRVRRIFPALLVVLIACLVAGWLTLFSVENMRLGKHVAGAAVFVSNFLLWNEAGYFDTAAQLKPLLHLWSLGIEEQFYIVWPLLLFLAWKVRAGLLAIMTCVLVVSFVANILLIEKAAEVFYSPLTRFWELVAGSILAYLFLYKPNLEPAPAPANLMSVTGFAMIAVAIAYLNPGRGFPGWWALLPVAGTTLMIAAGPGTWINRQLLSNRGLVAIGLISYPLYLWHWPILSFYRLVEGQAPSVEHAALAIVASFVLATLTYFMVEEPIRFGKRPAARTFVPLLALMAVVGAAGYVVYLGKGFPNRTEGRGFNDIIAAQTDFDGGSWQTKDGGTIDTLENALFVAGKPGADVTALVGDSTMQQYIARVRYLANQGAIDLDNNRVAVAICGALPIPEVVMEGDPVCSKLWPKTIAALNDDKVKTVAFAAQWTNHIMFAGLYLRDIGPEHNIRFSEPAREGAYLNLETLLKRLVNSGKRVILMLETPVGWGWANGPEKMLPTGWDRLFREPISPAPATRKFVDDYNGAVNRRLRAIAAAAGAEVIDPMDYLCDKEACPALKDGRAIYFNWNHLRSAFVREHATWIDQIVRPAGAPTPANAPAR